MARPKRFTKKLLDPLTTVELRRLAINCMGLTSEDAFNIKGTDLRSWVYDNKHLIMEADLELLDPRAVLRDGVVQYVEELKTGLRKEGEYPEWPPTDLSESTAAEEEGDDNESGEETEGSSLSVEDLVGVEDLQPAPPVEKPVAKTPTTSAVTPRMFGRPKLSSGPRPSIVRPSMMVSQTSTADDDDAIRDKVREATELVRRQAAGLPATVEQPAAEAVPRVKPVSSPTEQGKEDIAGIVSSVLADALSPIRKELEALGASEIPDVTAIGDLVVSEIEGNLSVIKADIAKLSDLSNLIAAAVMKFSTEAYGVNINDIESLSNFLKSN
jgi:hypothetical protein